MHNENLIRVVDHANLRRDRHSNAVIDVDDQAYNQYIMQKTARQRQEERISHLEETINKVESDISDIKSLLTQLLDK